MNLKAYSSLLFLIVVFLFACKHEAIMPEGFDPNGQNQNGPCDANTIYFEQQVLPILRSTCAVPGCHDVADPARKNVVLTSYTSLINSAEAWDDSQPLETEFWDVIFDGEMPLATSGKKLSQEQKDIIREWLAQGAKNNTCPELESCDTLDVVYSNQIVRIIETHCKGCHSGNDPQAGISLEDYASVKAVASFKINDTSLLIGVVSHADGFVQMPYNQPQLSDCKIIAIKKWIQNGMPL